MTDTTVVSDVPTPKFKFTRKAVILGSAVAGLIIAGGIVLPKIHVSVEDEDTELETPDDTTV